MIGVPEMTVGPFRKDEWEQAYQVAEEKGFDDIDSLEHEDGGELAQYVAMAYGDHAGNDEGKLYAAIQAAGQVWDRWDSEQFERVLGSWSGETWADEKQAVEDYLKENFEGFPIEEVRDVAHFYKTYVKPEGEMSGEDQPGGDTLHWFKRDTW